MVTQIKKQPNPQGKGCVPVLQDLALLRPQVPEKKGPSDILRDYCLSALVLAAQIRFKPVLGRKYYLFSDEKEWRLSLVGPEEWGNSAPGEFVATCWLHVDMTWKLDFGSWDEDSPVYARLERFIDSFSQSLAGQGSLVEGLPFYVKSLPYYPRMLATGLAVSLADSIATVDAAALSRSVPALRIGRDFL